MKYSLFIFSLFLLECCQDPSSHEQASTSDVNVNETTNARGNTTQGTGGFESDGEIVCFAARLPSPDNHFNYEFIRFSKEENAAVSGYFIFAPYGTDGSSGSMKGVWRDDDNTFMVTASLFAEGERYEEQRTYALVEEGLDLGYDKPDGSDAILPRVTCASFDVLVKEYRQQIMRSSLNVTDRERLKQVIRQDEFRYGDEEIDGLKFMERYIDLDHDGTTAEYLLYIMDPIVCGTGGCNLYVVNEAGDIFSSMSVTRPPIYMPLTGFEEDQNNKGEWKDLYVYSKGMRRLVPDNGNYPSNPSVEPEIPEELLLAFPDRYRLVMDYID